MHHGTSILDSVNGYVECIVAGKVTSDRPLSFAEDFTPFQTERTSPLLEADVPFVDNGLSDWNLDNYQSYQASGYDEPSFGLRAVHSWVIRYSPNFSNTPASNNDFYHLLDATLTVAYSGSGNQETGFGYCSADLMVERFNDGSLGINGIDFGQHKFGDNGIDQSGYEDVDSVGSVITRMANDAVL